MYDVETSTHYKRQGCKEMKATIKIKDLLSSSYCSTRINLFAGHCGNSQVV